MTEIPPPGPHRRAAALRYTLAVLDEVDRQAAGAAPDTDGMKMELDEALALAPELAYLMIDALSTLGAELGRTPEERPAFVRNLLLAHTEGAEVDASFAAVEAEVKGAGG